MTARTLYDKLWDAHEVVTRDDGSSLLYIDRQILHEVTSPQAFSGLRMAQRPLWRRDTNIATIDHNVPTTPFQTADDIADETSRLQVKTLIKNTNEAGILRYGIGDKRQGIVHVMAPEQGAVLPGMTVVCGDSHTSTNGALACLAHGIGTSEVEHVMATQCLVTTKMKNMLIRVEGGLAPGVTAKDVILHIIGLIGTAGGTGYAMEYAGSTIRSLSMEGRMTMCNMSIEAGARAGMVAVDDKTIEYVRGRRFAPTGAEWDKAEGYWRTLVSDEGAHFDKVVEIDAADIKPQVSWGTSPEMVVPVDSLLPDPEKETDPVKKSGMKRAYEYMDLTPGMKVSDIPIDKVFLGSCTNARIEDLRAAAAVVRGRKKATSIKQVLVVPGSGLVKEQAEREGLDVIFKAAGFEWRDPGCSMCLAMNPDRLQPGEHCASTSNRNFEGRQGNGGRTHLVSPAMAAAAAIAGHFVDVREMLTEEATA